MLLLLLLPLLSSAVNLTIAPLPQRRNDTATQGSWFVVKEKEKNRRTVAIPRKTPIFLIFVVEVCNRRAIQKKQTNKQANKQQNDLLMMEVSDSTHYYYYYYYYYYYTFLAYCAQKWQSCHLENQLSASVAKLHHGHAKLGA